MDPKLDDDSSSDLPKLEPKEPGSRLPIEKRTPERQGEYASVPELEVIAEKNGLPAPEVRELGSLRSEKRSTEEQRELLRGAIAYALLAMLGFVVVAAFITLWFDWGTGEDLETLLTALFAPIIGLVGAVTGFYYGERSAQAAQGTTIPPKAP